MNVKIEVKLHARTMENSLRLISQHKDDKFSFISRMCASSPKQKYYTCVVSIVLNVTKTKVLCARY